MLSPVEFWHGLGRHANPMQNGEKTYWVPIQMWTHPLKLLVCD